MDDVNPFARARKLFVLAAVGMTLGLAVAGTVDRTTGGVLLVASWIAAVGALHRLGRAGSTRES